MGFRDDIRLERLLVAIWRSAKASGPFVRPEDGHPSRPAPLNVDALSQSLHGVVQLSTGARIVCGAVAIRVDDGPDCLIFYVPVGALERADGRVGAFMGEHDAPSRKWRRPLDRWLADIAIDAYSEVPFEIAVIGFEAFTALDEETAASKSPIERYGAHVRPVEGVPRYYESPT